jgi:hypothetical protein
VKHTQDAIVSLIREALRSNRWNMEDTPGSANLKELHEYPGVSEELKCLGDSELKNFYLAIVNDIERSLNDDWLPNEMFGLPLFEARRFLMDIWPIIQEFGLEAAERKITECHAEHRKGL